MPLLARVVWAPELSHFTRAKESQTQDPGVRQLRTGWEGVRTIHEAKVGSVTESLRVAYMLIELFSQSRDSVGGRD